MDDAVCKNACSVFRAICKLSIEALLAEHIADLKPHGMRSNPLCLHPIQTTLKSYGIW